MTARSPEGPANILSVMPGLGPGIHVFAAEREDVDGRDKPGHDEGGVLIGCRNGLVPL